MATPLWQLPGSWTVACSTVTPNRASSSPRLLPYFSCSCSASTISPPPPATYASRASISSAAKTGLPTPVVRSQRSAEGCATTKTSHPSSTAGVIGPSVCARTVWPSRRSAVAASA